MSDTVDATDGALQPLGKTARTLKLRLLVMMFLQYFVQGCYLPIISLYLQDALGFSADQIGLFGAALSVGPMIAPFFIGQLVDRHMATERVLAFCHLAGGVIMLALYAQQFADLSDASRFWLVIAAGTMYSTLYVPSLMLTNSLTFHHLKDRDREFPLIRLWGTIGFILPAWLVEGVYLKGLTGDDLNSGRGIALALAGGSGLLMGLYSLTLPSTPPEQNKTSDFAPAKVIGLLRYRYFLVLVCVSLLIAIVHKFYFVWNSPFLKVILQKGAVTGALEQRISSIGQISEVAVMAGLGVLILRVGFKRTMLIGAFAYLLRTVLFALAVMVDAPYPVVMGVVCLGQALHGFCFGCFLAAAFMYVDRAAPVDVRGSMQNLYGTFVLGVGFFVGGIVAGRVGAIFTTAAGSETLRTRWGITTTAGFSEIATTAADGTTQLLLRDWPGIWLAGGVMAAVAIIMFAIGFPSGSPDDQRQSA